MLYIYDPFKTFYNMAFMPDSFYKNHPAFGYSVQKIAA